MKFPILLASIFALAGSAFGQLPPTSVNTIADLLTIKPNIQKPLVFVLGSTSANDGFGGDYIWSASSGAPTNTAQNGGPIAAVYGDAFGRWIKRTQYIPTLRNPTLYGTVSFPSTATVTFSAGGSLTVDRVISTSDSFTEVNPQALVTKAYVDAVGLGGSTNAVVPLNSMAELVAVAGTSTHGSAYYLRTYYTNDWAGGVGGGIWYWDPISNYPTNRAVIASARGGRFFPQLHNSNLDPRQFGAVTLRPASTTDQGVQDAMLMQQDLTYNQGKVLSFGEGVYRVATTIVSPRTGTGSGYTVNSGTNNPVGTTIIYASGGSGTIIAGDNIQFSTSETEPTYRVATALAAGSFTINAPGLQSVIATGTPIYVRPMRPLVIKGINNGIHLNPQFRAQMASEIMMETANIPIIECRETKHGRIEDLSLVYQTAQLPSQTNAACIYNGPDDEIFQWTIKGIAMKAGAYGIHIQTSTAGKNNGCANNRFDDLLVRSANLQCLRFAKSGTVNRLGYAYIQNGSVTITNGAFAPSETQSWTNASKTTPGTEITLNLTQTPGGLQVGSFFSPSGTNAADANFSKQAFVKSITNNVLIYDCESAYSAQAMVGTGGSLTAVQRVQATQPMVYFNAGFEFDAQAWDVEGAIGPATAGVPTFIDNEGIGNIGFLHMEYAANTAPDGALLRNKGQMTINNCRTVNCGKLAEINAFIFENNGSRAWLKVDHIGIYDLSDFPGSTGAWYLQTNKASAVPVVIGKYTRYPVIRNNATSTIDPWGAKTYDLIDLP